MLNIIENYDVAVIGAGHAGCEAALAAARLGMKTLVITVSLDSVAFMPCNPNVGGTSKGHLVREIDALGGEMGKNIDRTFIQSKMLNASKGPAVHSLRAQADKSEYSRSMRKVLENTDNITLLQTEAAEIIVENGICKGLKTISEATEQMKKGLSMSLFPEGTRNHQPELLPFKPGGYRMAEKSKCAIVVTSMTGFDDIFENNKPLAIRKRHVIIEFAPPVYPHELSKDARKEFYDSIPSKIMEMQAGK